MARLTRITPAGILIHLIQHGNNRQVILPIPQTLKPIQRNTPLQLMLGA